jgi:hypothetical protein
MEGRQAFAWGAIFDIVDRKTTVASADSMAKDYPHGHGAGRIGHVTQKGLLCFVVRADFGW